MPERCPFCGGPIESTCVMPENGHPYEEWRCADCDKTWRHPEEAILDRSPDSSKHGDQLDRRDANTGLDWWMVARRYRHGNSHD